MIKFRNIYFFLTFVGIATFPIYIFPNGGIQISHIFLLTAAALLILNRQGVKFNNDGISLAVTWLLVWMLIRQSIYSAEVQTLKLLPVGYMVFNIIISYLTISLIYNYRSGAIKMLFLATTVSVLIALGSALISGVSLVEGGATNYRSTGAFNNANQLGYFSLCSGGLLTVLWARFKLNTLLYYAAFSLTVFLAILSLSKAAMISIIVYALIWVTKKSHWKIIHYFILVSSVVAISISDLSKFKFFGRLNDMQLENDNILSRGYHLLGDMNLAWFYGRGKGYDQLHLPFNIEFHSTFGSLFLAYGLLGILPILYLFWRLFLRIRSAQSLFFAVAILLPIVMYGVTHNGIRATLAWVFLSSCFAAMNINRDGDLHPCLTSAPMAQI